MTDQTHARRTSVPGRLKAVLAVLGLQILANAAVGWLLLDELIEDADHGRSVDGAGWFAAVAILSLLVAVVAAVCVVFTVRPRAWARPVVIVIEVLAIISSLVNLVSGMLTAVIGIALAVGVIAALTRGEVRDWYAATAAGAPDS